jgi:hypothetical protein
MDMEKSVKIYKATEEAGNAWAKYCYTEEKLRQLTENMPDSEKQEREIMIEVKIRTFNREEDFRGYEKEKSFVSARKAKLDIKTIDSTIAYLQKIKTEYAKKQAD